MQSLQLSFTLSAGPDQVANKDVAVLEQFTFLLYDHASYYVCIDEFISTFILIRDKPWMTLLLPKLALYST